MAVNPAQLKSLVDQHSSGPSASSLGMAPPDLGAEPDDDDMDMDDDAEPVDPAAKGAQLIADWGEFGDALKESATDMHDLAEDCGAGLLLKEPDEDAIKAVEKSVDSMPDDLSMGLAKYVSKLSPEDTEAVTAALVAEIGADKADDKLLAAYIAQAAKYAGEEIEVDEDFNEPDEDEEDGSDEPDAGDEAPAESDPAADPY